jgi:hypothetical protein
MVKHEFGSKRFQRESSLRRAGVGVRDCVGEENVIDDAVPVLEAPRLGSTSFAAVFCGAIVAMKAEPHLFRKSMLMNNFRMISLCL